MREHGIDFPDPQFDGGAVRVQIRARRKSSIDPESRSSGPRRRRARTYQPQLRADARRSERVAHSPRGAALLPQSPACAIALGTDGDRAARGAVRTRTAPRRPSERRDLVDRERVDGTLGYAASADRDRAPRARYRLPHPGSVIAPRRDALYASTRARPCCFYGRCRRVARLQPRMTDGADVRQLERNLRALGYDPGDVDGDGRETTAAVGAFQQTTATSPRPARSTRARCRSRRPRRVIGEAKAAVGGQAAPGARAHHVLDAARRDVHARRQPTARPGSARGSRSTCPAARRCAGASPASARGRDGEQRQGEDGGVDDHGRPSGSGRPRAGPRPGAGRRAASPSSAAGDVLAVPGEGAAGPRRAAATRSSSPSRPRRGEPGCTPTAGRGRGRRPRAGTRVTVTRDGRSWTLETYRKPTRRRRGAARRDADRRARASCSRSSARPARASRRCCT